MPTHKLKWIDTDTKLYTKAYGQWFVWIKNKAFDDMNVEGIHLYVNRIGVPVVRNYGFSGEFLILDSSL